MGSGERGRASHMRKSALFLRLSGPSVLTGLKGRTSKACTSNQKTSNTLVCSKHLPIGLRPYYAARRVLSAPGQRCNCSTISTSLSSGLAQMYPPHSRHIDIVNSSAEPRRTSQRKKRPSAVSVMSGDPGSTMGGPLIGLSVLRGNGTIGGSAYIMGRLSA